MEAVLSTSLSVVEPSPAVMCVSCGVSAGNPWCGGVVSVVVSAAGEVGFEIGVVVGVWMFCCVAVDCSGLSATWFRRGACRIMRSICRCVLRNRFSSSSVRVHASAPYRTVGVIVP